MIFFCGLPRSSPENLLFPSLPVSRLSGSELELSELGAVLADGNAGCESDVEQAAMEYSD
jgi:hypothetical protein